MAEVSIKNLITCYHKTCIKCGNCYKEPEKPKKCSGCLTMFYCSQECQKAHWSKHKEQCSELRLANSTLRKTRKYNIDYVNLAFGGASGTIVWYNYDQKRLINVYGCNIESTVLWIDDETVFYGSDESEQIKEILKIEQKNSIQINVGTKRFINCMKLVDNRYCVQYKCDHGIEHNFISYDKKTFINAVKAYMDWLHTNDTIWLVEGDIRRPIKQSNVAYEVDFLIGGGVTECCIS